MAQDQTLLANRSFVTTLLLICISISANAFTVSFRPAVNYPVGTAPQAIAVGDFNGDGKPDLVVANLGNPQTGDDGSISVLLGNGDGTFQSAHNFAGGKNPSSIATADFNRDGKTDLVLIDSSGVGVLMGNGDGTFGSVTYLATASGPLSLAVADFNADNITDLVVVAQSSLSVLLGNGDGTFQAHVDYPAGGPNVSAADINGDRKIDVITERPQGGGAVLTTVLLGNGDGTFGNGIVTTGFQLGGQLVVSDFNEDGKPDIALGFIALGKGTFIMAGNGDGTFQQSSATLSLFGTTSVSDFNGDGRSDLVIIDVSSGGIASLFVGNGDGTFKSPLSFAVGAAPANFAPSWAVAVAELDQDNEPDLVVTNSPDNNISVLLNTTGADFSITASAPTPGTINRGQSATSTVTLAHLNSFDNPVALSCSVQPAQSATCSLNPNSILFDASGNASATLTINTSSATALLGSHDVLHDSSSLQFLFSVAGLAIVGAGFGSRRSIRRTVMACVLGSVLFGGLIFQAACGGSRGAGPTTYTITITGTSASTQHSTTVPLIVK